MELEEVALKLFSEIRRESGGFRTGVCQLKGRKTLFLNKNQTLEERIFAIAGAISKQNIDEVYMKPVVRAEIEHQLEIISKGRNILGRTDGQ